jgi:hypothetical protein
VLFSIEFLLMVADGEETECDDEVVEGGEGSFVVDF